MGAINATDINNLNSNVYKLGTNSKFSTNLSTKFQSSAGNNVSSGSKAVPININELKSAINVLEQKFSNNCCQSQCHTYTTVSSCQVSVCQSSTCQSCQACQYCQYTKYSQYDKYSHDGGL